MQTKTKKALEWSIFSFIGLLAVMAGSLFFYQVTYASKIYHNVYFTNIDLSNKTTAQAKALIQTEYDKVLNRQFTLKSDQGEITTKLADTGLGLDVDKIVKDSYNIGRSKSFFAQLLESGKTLFRRNDTIVEPKIDQEKFSNFINIAVAQLNIEPQNATISIENGQVKITPEKPGQTVNTTDLMTKIMDLADNPNVNEIALISKAKAADVQTANFAEAQQYANSILAKNVTLLYADKTYAPNKSDLGLWIKFDNNGGKYVGSLNESNISAYLARVAKDFEIQKKDKKINATDGAVLDPGVQGLYLDKNDAIGKIKSQINSASVQVTMITYTEDPAEVKVFPSEGVVAGRFPGKYIDVDLAAQKLCRVEGPSILDCFTVSSGKPSTPTVLGTFAIQNKNPRAWSSEYGLYMPWWQAFHGPYGLHELPEWPGGKKEGENHLGTPVSHGCVRMGVGTAEMVYNWTDIGTPVYVHK